MINSLTEALNRLKSAQDDLAAWFAFSEGKASAKKAELTSKKQEGFDFSVATVMRQGKALLAIEGTETDVPLQKLGQLFVGVKDLDVCDRLVKAVSCGLSVKEARKMLPESKAKKNKRIKARYLYNLCKTLPNMRRLLLDWRFFRAAIAAGYVGQEEEIPFTLVAQVVQKKETIAVRPEEIESEIWEKFSEYEQKQAIELIAGKTVVCAMHNFVAPYTSFIYWARARNGVLKIDRTNKVYGNPFKVGEDGTLTEVLEKYQEKILKDPAMLNRIPQELSGKALACWCKKGNGTARCHGDILAEIANKGN